MKRSKSAFRIQCCIVLSLIFLNINTISAADYSIDSNNKVIVKTPQFVTNLETVINSTSLISLAPVVLSQETEDEEKPKEVKSKKKWYITAGTLIVSSVSAYLLLLDKGNGKAKIPGPPSRPANP